MRSLSHFVLWGIPKKDTGIFTPRNANKISQQAAGYKKRRNYFFSVQKYNRSCISYIRPISQELKVVYHYRKKNGDAVFSCVR